MAALMLRVTGVDITRYPVCRAGHLPRSIPPLAGLTAGLVAIFFRPGARPVPALDTS